MAQIEQDKDGSSLPHTKVSARFEQFRSPYWAAVVAALPLRYGLRVFERNKWDNPKAGYFTRHKYAAMAGGLMYGVTGFYAWRTWKDMRNIFSEALALEFNKDPKDIGFGDFWKSDNTIVQQTARNYVKYNVRRALANVMFFSPFIAKPVYKKYDLHPETGVDVGVFTNSAYLVSDVMTRRITPFESLQSIIDLKINHTDNVGDQITADDLMDIYESSAAESGTKRSFAKWRGTPQWETTKLFERMAELMNQAYKNTVRREEGNFTLPKLIYLIGHGMIDPDHLNRSMAYVEIASKYGIHEVNKVAGLLDKGMSLEEATRAYTIHFVPVAESAVESLNLIPRDLPANGLQQVLKEKNTALGMVGREEERQAKNNLPTYPIL